MIVSAGLPVSNVVDEEEKKDIISQLASAINQKVDRADIVSSVGYGNNKVMSQSATTEAIEGVESRVAMTEKRIENIEESFSADSFVVKTDGIVPANALPYARVLKVGGMTYRDEAPSPTCCRMSIHTPSAIPFS